MMTAIAPVTPPADFRPFRRPSVPSGQDPLTYGHDKVEAALRAAYFSLFSVPDPNSQDVPIPAELPFGLGWIQTLLEAIPGVTPLLAGVEVNEAPLRLKTATELAACQLLGNQQVGQSVATVHIDWTPIPWSYRANPDTRPPQTILNPFASQRFEMLNGEFRFQDRDHSGFHGFGSGRTFPNFPRGLSLKIGAVINILEGFGDFAGHHGTIVVNGEITPPEGLNLNLMVRVVDPDGSLSTQKPLPPFSKRPFPDPSATFMMFSGESDPDQPAELLADESGGWRLELTERLRLVELDFGVPGGKLVSRATTGPVVGRVSSEYIFTPGGRNAPLSVRTAHTELTFGDDRIGSQIGTLRADLVEGRGFPTPVRDLSSPLLRVGGFGPIQGGSGEFRDAQGMLSVNGAMSLFPRLSSHLYVFRFVDPDGRLRPYPADGVAPKPSEEA